MIIRRLGSRGKSNQRESDLRCENSLWLLCRDGAGGAGMGGSALTSVNLERDLASLGLCFHRSKMQLIQPAFPEPLLCPGAALGRGR